MAVSRCTAVSLKRISPLVGYLRCTREPVSFRCLSTSVRCRKKGAYDDDEPTYGQAAVDNRKFHHIDTPYNLYYGGVLREVQIAYETFGQLNEARDNVIFLQTGLTGSAHARSHEGVPGSDPGWWENFIGPGGKIDTNKFMVVCQNSLGSCYGTTGPGSTNPIDNKPYGSRFPAISCRDMVGLNTKLLDHLGIDKVHAVIGPSLGGATSLLFAGLFPERLNRVVSISGCPSAVPIAIAFRYLQRCSIMNDPAWKGGDFYDGQWPTEGLRFARKVSTITYRGGNEWHTRFGRKRVDSATSKHPILYSEEFQIEEYIEYQGSQQAKNISYDPNSLIHISKAIDVFDIADHFGSFDEAMRSVKCPTLIMGSSSDILYPTWQQEEMYKGIKAQGNKDVRLEIVDSDYGHDAFLLELERMGNPMKEFLEQE